MTRLLVVVHGMGEHDPGWSDGAIELLNEAGQRCAQDHPTSPYRFTLGEDEGADIVVREVAYNHVFETFLARSERSAEKLMEWVEDEELDLDVEGLWTWLAGLNDDKREFFLTHVSDVVLFRLFREVRKHAIEEVIGQIVQAVGEFERGAGDVVDVSIMAHSLGTAVTQQALERLATEPLINGGERSDVFMAASPYHFRLLAMIANVSRVLERGDVYRSIVGPPRRAGMEQGKWYVHQYHTYRHELDPFTLFRAFDRTTEQWGDFHVQPADLRHYVQINPHGVEHYLQHPAVHLPLFNGVYGAPAVSRSYIHARVAAYNPPPPTQCNAEMQRLSTEATAIIERYRGEQNFVGFCKAVTDFLFLVRELEDDCPQLAQGDLG